MPTFPVSYGIDPKQYVQGPSKLWFAPYQAAGSDPSQGAILSLGSLDKNGIEFDHKLTYSGVEIDQATAEADSFLTKQEFDIKATIVELSPGNLAVALGARAAALTSGFPPSATEPATLSLGEPFDILSSSSIPSMRALAWQLIFQFASPGHDNNSSPIGAYAFIQLWKCYVQSHGPIKFSKDAHAMCQVTFRAIEDFTVGGAYKIGKIVTS